MTRWGRCTNGGERRAALPGPFGPTPPVRCPARRWTACSPCWRAGAATARRSFRRELTRGAAHVPVPGVALGETCDIADPSAIDAPRTGASLRSDPATRRSTPDTRHLPRPATSEDQSVVAVLDGFLLNHATLRHRLEGAGHRLQGDSHAELLVHLYEDQGPACFEHVEGPLAAAVWDTGRRTLVLARDPLGQKPLFYRAEPGRLLFANRLAALTEAAAVPREIDPTALDEYLTFGYVPPPHCLWRGFQKLPPGYVAICQDGQLTFRRYWAPDWQREDGRCPAELERDLRERLETSVASCLDGQERVGVWLSGSVDAAIIAALARRVSSQPLQTFSFRSPLAEDGQSAAAEAIARHLGAEHRAIWLDPSAHGDVASFLGSMDEPLADPLVVTQCSLAAGTAQHVPCVLTGLGADELLAGYPRYGRVLAWQERLPAWLQVLLPMRRRAAGGSDLSPPALNEARARRYLSEISVFDEAARSQLYADEFLSQLPAADPYDLLRTTWPRRAGAIRSRPSAWPICRLRCLACNWPRATRPRRRTDWNVAIPFWRPEWSSWLAPCRGA